MNRAFLVRPATWRDDQRELRSVRQAVFVVEQKIDADEEFDDIDPRCQHFLAVETDGTAVGTCRIDSDGKIGRMAVLSNWRKAGVGRALLQEAVAFARLNGLHRVHLHSQSSAMGFYERNGFAGYGARFYEAGIEHVAMAREL